MGTSAHQDDPMLRLRYYRETGQADEAKNYERYLRETGQFAEDEKPGVISRGLSQLGAGLSHAIEHPIDFATSLVRAPVESAANIVAPSVEGAAKYNADPMAQARNVARFGGELHAQGVTRKERAAGIAQTAANVLTPELFSAVKAGLAPSIGTKLATGAGLATAGGATGAAYSPNDPGAGAIAGGIAAPVLGGVAAGASKGATKLTDLVRNTSRIVRAQPIDAAAVEHTAATEAASRENYGRAAAEGEAAGGTTPALREALDDPLAKGYADRFRKSSRGAKADDATVARETYKLMSKVRRGLQKRMDQNGYDADLDLQRDDLAVAMKRLKDATAAPSTKPPITLDVAPEVFEAAPKVTPGREAMSGPVSTKNLSESTTPPKNPTLRQALRDFPAGSEPASQGPGGPGFQLRAQPEKVTPGVRIETPAMRVQTAPPEEVGPAMPSFPEAVAERARMGRERDLFNRGVGGAKRIASGKQPSAQKLDTQSEAALLRDIGLLSPEDAAAMERGLLGGAKEEIKFHAPTAQSTSLLANLVQPAFRLHRLAPAIEALDQQVGRPRSLAHRVLDPLATDEILQLLGIPAGALTHP